MKYKMRYEAQKKRLSSLLDKNQRLRLQNANMQKKIDALSDELEMYKYQMKSVEEIKNKYMNGLEELRVMRDYYKNAIREVHLLKNEYAKKFKELVNELKRQT